MKIKEAFILMVLALSSFETRKMQCLPTENISGLVCGYDGLTYSSLCTLRQSNSFLHHNGPCNFTSKSMVPSELNLRRFCISCFAKKVSNIFQDIWKEPPAYRKPAEPNWWEFGIKVKDNRGPPIRSVTDGSVTIIPQSQCCLGCTVTQDKDVHEIYCEVELNDKKIQTVGFCKKCYQFPQNRIRVVMHMVRPRECCDNCKAWQFRDFTMGMMCVPNNSTSNNCKPCTYDMGKENWLKKCVSV